MTRTTFMTTALVTGSGLAFAAHSEAGSGSPQVSTNVKANMTGQKRDRSQGRPDVSAGSIARMTPAGIPGTSFGHAVLKDFDEMRGAGGWTNVSDDAGEATAIDGEDFSSQMANIDQMHG